MEMRSRPVSGFTLLELMVAVALVAILVAVAIPSYQSLRQEQMVQAATQAVYTDMMLLKSEAIKRGVPLTLKIFNAGQSDWCYRIAIDSTCSGCTSDCSSIEGRKGVDAGEFAGVILDSTFEKLVIGTGTEIALEFNNRRGSFDDLNGFPDNGSICLKSGASKRSVIVAPVGRIKTGDVTGTPPCN